MPDDPLKVSHWVKQFLDKRIKGGCDPRKAVMNIRQNIVNAQNNYPVDEKGVPPIFSTNMFLFAEAILPYIKQWIGIEEELVRTVAEFQGGRVIRAVMGGVG